MLTVNFSSAPLSSFLGCKPKPPKIPPRQIEPHYDHIQGDELPVATEGAVAIHVDVAPCRRRGLRDPVQDLRVLAFLVLDQQP